MNKKEALEIIIDNQPFSCWLKDREGNYIAVNKAFAEYSTVSKEDIVGKNDFSLYPADEAEMYCASDALVLQGETQAYYELLVNGKWKEEFKKIARDSQGNLVGTTGFARDITSRKEIEKALRESERSKAVLLSNLPGVAYRCRNDKEWTMTFLSEGCLELTGYTTAELIDNEKLTVYQLIDPEAREEIFKRWDADVELKLKSNDEYKITTKAGEEKWVWEQSIPVQDANGEYSYSEGFILDITKSKETENSLRESEDRFRTIFDEAPLGIGIFHTQTGAVYELNRKFGQILGRSLQELVRLDWKSYSHPDELEENLYKLELLKKKKIDSFSMNKRFFKPDGSVIWVNMVIAPFKAETISDLHLCMIEDITLNKAKEQEIAHLSYHDSLTGLYNRRFFQEEEKRFDQSRTIPVSLIMGDVNGLKLINDSFGHLEGDKLLKEMAGILQESCRGEDFISRVGGDEFIIFMNQADSDAAKNVCDRIYKACREYENTKDRQTFALSISLGYATKTETSQKTEDLLRQAEEMLYKKKNSDRKKTRKMILAAVKKELLLENYPSQEDFDYIMKLTLDTGEKMRLSSKKMKDLQLLMEVHDIGKLSSGRNNAQNDKIRVGDDDLLDYKKHPEKGARIALGTPELKNLAEEIISHHEQWDGSGFPKGIKGERIPLLARIVNVTDACRHILQDGTAFREESTDKLVEFIRENAGTKFDPQVAGALTEVLLQKTEKKK